MDVDVEVVDEAARPMTGIEVRLLPEEPRLTGIHEVQTTGESGRVAWRGVASGNYQVMAATPAAQPLRWAWDEVRPRGEQATVQVRLVFKPVDSLHGQVVDETGQPLPGAEVRAVPSQWAHAGQGNDPGLMPHGSRLMAQWLGQDGPPLHTGPDGHFNLSGLQRAGWLVTALKEGYVLDTRAMGSSLRWLGPQVGVYAVPHPEAGPVRLVLRRGGHVVGRVVGTDGSPLSDFQLNGYDVESPEGHFLWSLAQGRETVLTFTAPGLAGTVRRVLGGKDGAVELGDVVLEEGRTVRVRPVDAESGEPLLSAWVQVVVPDAPSELEDSLQYRPPYDGDYDPVEREIEEQIEFKKRQEAGGAVTLVNVPEESVVLLVRAPDHRTARVRLGATEQEVTVTLQASARLEGTVLVEGKPLKSGLVTLFTAEEEVPGTLIENGKYVMSGLEPGSYLVEVRAYVRPPHPVFLSQRVEVPSRGVVRLDFEDWRGGGRVEVLPAEPVDRVYLVAGNWPMPATADNLRRVRDLGRVGDEEGGRIRFQHIPGGVHTLFAVREWHSHLVPIHREVLELAGSGEQSVVLRPTWVVLP